MSDSAKNMSAPQPLPFQEQFDRMEKLKEIDIAGIEPMLPPVWKEDEPA